MNTELFDAISTLKLKTFNQKLWNNLNLRRQTIAYQEYTLRV